MSLVKGVRDTNTLDAYESYYIQCDCGDIEAILSSRVQVFVLFYADRLLYLCLTVLNVAA